MKIKFNILLICLFIFLYLNIRAFYADETKPKPEAKNPVQKEIPKSSILTGLTWLSPRIQHPGKFKGDVYPLGWAEDDVMYSAAGDPVSEAKKDGMCTVMIKGGPLDYTVDVTNPMLGFNGWGGHGLKPTGMLSYKGELYMFAHNLGYRTNENAEKCHGYDAQIFKSLDKGKTWLPNIKEVEKKPMFPGREFGSPTFIIYGKNHENATDEFIYSLSGDGWANGNTLKLGRVPADKIMDVNSWEFVAEFDSKQKPVWKKDYKLSIPVLEDPGFLGYPEAVYIASIKRYLVFGWHFKKESAEKYSPNDGSELSIYEAPQPWGPYSLVAKMDWETPQVTPYNPRLPLKWFDGEKLEGYLLFSGSWRDGGSSEFYRSHVRKFKLEKAVSK